MTTSHVAPPDDAQPVQALVRAFSILEALAGRPAGLSLRDLSRKVGLHKSTTFRMVRTMVRLGYVIQLEESKFYRIADRLPGWSASRR